MTGFDLQWRMIMLRITCVMLYLATLAAAAAATITPVGQMVVTDPVWSEEPDDHNTFAPTDLTELRVVNGPNELWLDIPFSSDWNGLILHVLLETRFDAAGATMDPFMQPVTYAHALKPDYAVTCLYSANDYGDCRRWNSAASRWEWYDPATGTWSASSSFNVVPLWTDKRADQYSVRIPWGAFGGRPDSLMVAVYLTQEDGVKRSAFDSVPSDATLDLDFDWENPAPGDWDTALQRMTLSAWSPVYRVRTEFPSLPQLAQVTAAPDTLAAGSWFVLAADVVDMGGGIGPVVADIESLGGAADEVLHDDGSAAHGDAVAGDGRYSLRCFVPQLHPGGRHPVTVRAYDGISLQHSQIVCALEVVPPPALVSADDAEGDDHGPNQPGVLRRYYTYPTNPLFVPGLFDLTSLEIRRVQTIAGGVATDWIAFKVSLAEFPGVGEAGYVDWSSMYGELGIQKIDILIDARAGGSTASLPNRFAGYAARDAWDYAVILDGWVKAVVPYTGSDALAQWLVDARTSDQDIVLVGDAQANTVTALVAPAVLGAPSDAQIRGWDVCVQMASHDYGGSETLGGMRWVNGSVTEWNFGGGSTSNRDANLLDLLLVPGVGHAPGRPQEFVLDYESAEASARLSQGLLPVAIEVTGSAVSPVGQDVPGPLAQFQCVPNPFNPRATIRFGLPDPGRVSLAIHDVSGRLVRTLVDGYQAAGSHEAVWDGRDAAGREVGSGHYLARLVHGGTVETLRMTMIR
jgi:hypothetical protein